MNSKILPGDESPFLLGENSVPIVQNAVHLGMTEATQKARKALYALLGAGLRGVNGLTWRISLHINNVYVLPIMLHGLHDYPSSNWSATFPIDEAIGSNTTKHTGATWLYS